MNKQYVVTDVFLNDGYWHHICASWTSTNGSYHIYVDGKLIKNGSDLAVNTKIDGTESKKKIHSKCVLYDSCL